MAIRCKRDSSGVIVMAVRKMLVALTATLMIALLCACSIPGSPQKPAAQSENGFPMSDMSGYPAFDGYKGETVFYDLTVKDIEQLMADGESFSFIAAFASCPWCNLCIVQLNETALAEGAQVGYLNTRLNPNWKSNIDIDDYDVFVELFGDYLSEDADGIPHLYTPHVFFIKGGEVVSQHSGTVDDVGSPAKPLTVEQLQELDELYSKGFAAIKAP